MGKFNIQESIKETEKIIHNNQELKSVVANSKADDFLKARLIQEIDKELIWLEQIKEDDVNALSIYGLKDESNK